MTFKFDPKTTKIPDKICVGYKASKESYTGKLGSVSYKIGKKYRKEVSFLRGCDTKQFPIDELDNVPMKGFSINLNDNGVPFHDNRSKSTNAYVRVADPRGFDVNITAENFIHALRYTVSKPGEPLEGEFVYAWDNDDVILLPVASSEYNDIVHSRFNTVNFVKVKDLVLGGTYETKSGDKHIYLGKHEHYDYNGKSLGKAFIFHEKGQTKWSDGTRFFKPMKAISGRFVNVVSDQCVNNFDEIMSDLEHDTLYSPIDKNRIEIVSYSFNELQQYVDAEFKRYNQRVLLMNSIGHRIVLSHQDKRVFKCIIENNTTINSPTAQTIDAYTGSLRLIFHQENPTYKQLYLANGNKYKIKRY